MVDVLELFLGRGNLDFHKIKNWQKDVLLFKSLQKYKNNAILQTYYTLIMLIGLKMLNPEFHWLRQQIATTLRKFHWQFWIFLDAIAKAKKLICESIAPNLKWDSLTRRLFSFGNGI